MYVIEEKGHLKTIMAPKEGSFFQLHSVRNNERREMFFYLDFNDIRLYCLSN